MMYKSKSALMSSMLSYQILILLVSGSSGEIINWPDTPVNAKLTGLLLSEYGGQLFVSAASEVYNLNASNLQLLNAAQINEGVPENVLRLTVYNQTYSQPAYVTTCASKDDVCLIRSVDNLSDVKLELQKNVRSITGIQAFVVDSVHGSTHDSYLFVGCPHTINQEENEGLTGLCRFPGIFWFKDSGDDRNDGILKQKFKSFEKSDVKTEKFVAAFSVEKMRLFFSIQNHTDGSKISRVAQVCQYYDSVYKKYTTPHTYVDMPIKCGHFKEIMDVEKVVVGNITILVGVFTGKGESAVCVYTMAQVNQTFVENVKECYKGLVHPPNPDYFDYDNNDKRPCVKEDGTEQSFDETPSDEAYLCNPNGYSKFKHMIGFHELSNEPVIRLQQTTTALTISIVHSTVVAFLGMSDGTIQKASVYPSSGVIKEPVVLSYQSIIKDMVTSHDQKHVFVLTQQKVYKTPVESCSSFTSCSECLTSDDPHCGWCMLQNRCSTDNMCTGNLPVWISASSTDQCPSVLDIQPSLISEKDLDILTLNLSHGIQAAGLSCVFTYEHLIGDHSAPAQPGGNLNTIRCKPPSEIRESIQGCTNVTVSVVTSDSSLPIMTGYFSLYNCETFRSCSQCTDSKIACMWDKQNVKCNYVKRTDTTHDIVRNQTQCPRAESYTIQTLDGQPLTPGDRAWYLFKDEDYTITITGINLPVSSVYGFSCKVTLDNTHTEWINQTVISNNTVACDTKNLKYPVFGYHGELNTTVQFMFGSSKIEGDPVKAVVYECQGLPSASENCGYCKSFETSQPHYHCQWCDNSCIYDKVDCNVTDTECPNPTITKVYPLSVAVNASVLVEIEGTNLGSEYDDTVDAVTIAGNQCRSIKTLYEPGKRIVCKLTSSNIPVENGEVKLKLATNATGTYSGKFSIRVPTITSIEPVVGPHDGGTLITVHGDYLNTGIKRTVWIGATKCSKNESMTETKEQHVLVCKNQASKVVHGNRTVNISVHFDDVPINGGDNISFTYVANPNISGISPLKSFASGGRSLTVTGSNLYAIQKPMIYAKVNGKNTKREMCTKNGSDTLYCPSPRLEGDDITHNENRVKRNTGQQGQAILGFIMDDVSSVMADNLPADIAGIIYYPNPVIYNLTKTKELKEIQDDNLVIKGQGLDLAASREDVTVRIGCFMCDITDFTTETILCKPPASIPTCDAIRDNTYTVQVEIGYYKRRIGEVTKQIVEPEENDLTIAIVIPVIIVLLLCLILAAIKVVLMRKSKKIMQKNITVKLDKLEANFRNQCREEFANLQTTVLDLTTDLEGGNVLFREYSTFADKALFTSQKTESLTSPPPPSTEQSDKAMDAFKGLLRNTQFLAMFIKTLEQQRSFTIHDKSCVATILMILNHDNMEFITGILSSLLRELVDKNMTSGTSKLLLRRSESVAEKLLTHWLSICMYHDLKSKTGSALYILYKAIKIQTEKGPIDYITNCAKYTLSEDKLFTFGDKDIKPITLGLKVKHKNYINDEETQLTVSVLDCDTITQAKTKMLEIFYKNVPYSQRPSVHSTSLEVEEENGGTKRLLNDEDASSEKEGLWKRINTLQHYDIKDQATVILSFNKEMEKTCKTLIGVGSPDSFIVGSFRKSRPAVRTISGSNFWHLTMKHQRDEDAPQASDLFLPRLTTTKMTLQPYIDDLFTAVLSVGDEPSIIIKYLFDFLDMEASRCGVTDPDVVHTWKCNSLLLRFWVNIIKNPEFVFDIHKPVLVDSCLSVVAQTLMDSCSTADLILSKNSPSNKLLFAKDIPRYKTMVREYFQNMKEKPAVSDQDLNSYLTQNVSQKFSGTFNPQRALIELFNYAERYKDQLCGELDNLEASSPGTFSPLSSKLQYIFMCMDKK